MHWFQLQIHSIPYFTDFLLALAITGFLCLIKNKKLEGWLLTGFFAAFSLFFLNLFLAMSVSAGWQFYFPALHPIFFLLIGTSLIQFTYYFVSNPFKTESQGALIGTGIATLALTVFILTSLAVSGPKADIPMFRSVVVFALLLVWSLLVLLRKLIYFSRVAELGAESGAESQDGRRDPDLSASTFGRSLRYLAKPVGREALAQREFARVFLVLVFCAAFAAVCIPTGLLGVAQIQYVTGPALLVFLLGVVVVYFNHASDRATFQIKLIGLTLVTMLSLLGAVGLFLYTRSELVITGRADLPGKETLWITPTDEGGYQLRQEPPLASDQEAATDTEGGLENRVPVDFRDGDAVELELPFPFPFYGEDRHTVFVNKNGFVSFGGAPDLEMAEIHADSPYFYSQFYDDLPKIAVLFLEFDLVDETRVSVDAGRSDDEPLTISWQNLQSHKTESLYGLHLTLHPDGRIRSAFETTREAKRFNAWGGIRGISPGGDIDRVPSFLPLDPGRHEPGKAAPSLERGVVAGPGEALLQDHRAIFRQFSHSKISRIVGLIIGATFFIIFAFPFFFRENLVRPLASLLDGVEQVNQGRRDIQVPIRFNDEIGFLTANFNTMSRSIHAAEQQLEEYAAGLEERVRQRTLELQESLDELTRTQDQLGQAEKMAALGRLTSGVAHEMKNPLNFINNFSSMSVELVDDLRDEIETPKPDAEELRETLGYVESNLRKIHEHSLRADRIVSTMMAHSQDLSQDRDEHDLNHLLSNAVDKVRKARRDRDTEIGPIEVRLDFDSDLEPIEVSGQALSKAFQNILDNAFQALCDRKGAVDFLPQVSVTTRRHENRAEARIRDNGAGIPEAQIDKIFEPFFTTRPPTDGSVGMGLSLSYDTIVRGHGGTIEVESREGEFTLVYISLPFS